MNTTLLARNNRQTDEAKILLNAKLIGIIYKHKII
jgi:hypothetical protein